MSVSLTILGSGTSHGVPMVCCDCETCTSTDPHDQRMRPSALFTVAEKQILVDTTPEFRLQAIRANLTHLDAVLFTHSHADHIVGLDDLRRYSTKLGRALDVYGNAETIDRLQRMFRYAFDFDPNYPSEKPRLAGHVPEGPFEAAGVPVTPIPYLHGQTDVWGYRIGGIAYCTDCNLIPESSMPLLEDLDVLILDAVRLRPHATHFNLEQAIDVAQRIGAIRTYFTHIAHEIKHAAITPTLPERMALAHDGLVCTSKQPLSR